MDLAFRSAVGEMTAAPAARRPMRAFAGNPTPQIQQIISGWPQSLYVPRAEALGFVADSGIDEVI